jgi:hypothetical protein
MNFQEIYVKCVIYHRDMSHRQAANGNKGFQTGSIAANILNKESRTADKVWSSSSKGEMGQISRCYIGLRPEWILRTI